MLLLLVLTAFVRNPAVIFENRFSALLWLVVSEVVFVRVGSLLYVMTNCKYNRFLVSFLFPSHAQRNIRRLKN